MRKISSVLAINLAFSFSLACRYSGDMSRRTSIRTSLLSPFFHHQNNKVSSRGAEFIICDSRFIFPDWHSNRFANFTSAGWSLHETRRSRSHSRWRRRSSLGKSYKLLISFYYSCVTSLRALERQRNAVAEVLVCSATPNMRRRYSGLSGRKSFRSIHDASFLAV